MRKFIPLKRPEKSSRSVTPTDEVVARKTPPELAGLKRTLDEVEQPEQGD